jgi:hypothetical protein
MSNELAIPENMSLVKKTDTDVFDDFVSSGDYMSRIQLMTGNSGPVQQGVASVGEYVFIESKDDITQLGKEIDVLVCSWRLKAMEISDDAILSVYDLSDPNFMKIKAKAGVKDSGCMCGIEFMLWISSIQKFATFYMASKSAARVAKQVRSYIDEENNQPGPATLKSTLIETKKYKWHAPVVTSCSTPFNNPDQELFLKTLDKFQNPADETGGAEKADDTADDARER